MPDLVALLDLADIAIARADTAIDDESRGDLARVVRRARRKLGFVGEALVVAFAGGTGSGKSSLVNALVTDEIAPAGLVRPTTNEALAAIPRRIHRSALVWRRTWLYRHSRRGS